MEALGLPLIAVAIWFMFNKSNRASLQDSVSNTIVNATAVVGVVSELGVEQSTQALILARADNLQELSELEISEDNITKAMATRELLLKGI